MHPEPDFLEEEALPEAREGAPPGIDLVPDHPHHHAAGLGDPEHGTSDGLEVERVPVVVP